MAPFILSWLFLASFLNTQPLSHTSLPTAVSNIVTFGDSWSVPVNGWNHRLWPSQVVTLTGGSITHYPYARSGATCSNEYMPHDNDILPSESVAEVQLPAYMQERNDSGNPVSGIKAADTLYALWIGTNDLGIHRLLTRPGEATVVNTTECVISWVRRLYHTGARNFLIHTVPPLERTPLYAIEPPRYFPDGLNYTVPFPSEYWGEAHDRLGYHFAIREMVEASNLLIRLLTKELVSRIFDAHIGIFDAHGLIEDIIFKPEAYLNGTTAVNTVDIGKEQKNLTDRDSFVWMDELHMTEQMHRIVARQVVEIVEGKDNVWTNWIS